MELFGVVPPVNYKYRKGKTLQIKNIKDKESIHYFIKQCVTQPKWFDELMPKKEIDDIGIVFCDPPFGLKVADWDDSAWNSEEIKNALTPFFRSLSSVYLIYFLAESMIVNVTQAIPADCTVRFFYWYMV